MAEVTPADPSAEARTRARRTLIGSAILALTAVVVVPLVMDSKPRPWADDVQLQIPSKDSKFDTPLQAPPVVPSPSPAAAASPTASPTATPTAAKPAAPAAAETAPKAPPAPVAEAKPEAKAEPKPSPAAAPKETTKPEPAKPAAAKAADPKGEKSAGKVVLQAGAFTTEERIKAVEADLRKAGFTPYREEVPAKTGTVTRVRFTVASQDAAEKAIAKLSAAGITPKIIPQ